MPTHLHPVTSTANSFEKLMNDIFKMGLRVTADLSALAAPVTARMNTADGALATTQFALMTTGHLKRTCRLARGFPNFLQCFSTCANYVNTVVCTIINM